MEGREAPADGVITGWGDVDGRPVAIAAYDFTVMAGSMGMTGEIKMARLRELALQKRMPLIWLLDSAGARIQEATGSLFAGSGHLFREEVAMSGVVPLVAGDAGPVRRRDRLHPGPLGLRPDGRRPGGDGARRPAPDQGGDRRGDLDGGPRRGQGPLPQVGRRRPRVRRRRRVHRGDQDLPLLLSLQLRAEAAAARDRGPRRPDVGEAARHRPRVEPPARTTCTR